MLRSAVTERVLARGFLCNMGGGGGGGIRVSCAKERGSLEEGQRDRQRDRQELSERRICDK